MDNKTALEMAVSIAGGQSELKRRIDSVGRKVSQQAVNQWCKARYAPFGWAIWVARAVDFQVTPHELDPDNYPNAWDGLPLEKARPRMREALAA